MADEPPHLDVTIQETNIIEGAKHVLKLLRPSWNQNDVTFKVFTDGITNKLLGCFPDGKTQGALLIRVYGRKTDLLIDRVVEKNTMRLLHERKLGSELFATFQNGLVYEFLEGIVLTPDTCTDEHVSQLVAKMMADMHAIQVGGPSELWEKMNKFLQLVPSNFQDTKKEERYRTMKKADKAHLKEEFDFLKKTLTNVASPTVFCHNDLLLTNVIYNKSINTVAFIDFEYALLNYQAFDIANHFNEYAGVETVDYSKYPGEEYQLRWIKMYLERFKEVTNSNEEVTTEKVHEVYHQVQQFGLASHFFWTLWALIQAEHSTIDFDFLGYAFLRLNEYFSRKKIVFGL